MERLAGEDYLLFKGDFNVLSSAVFNGGYRRADSVVNLHVQKNYDGDPRETFAEFSRRTGLRNFVGLMTAVDLASAGESTAGRATAVVTAGLSNFSRVGTINTLVFLDADLAPGAMANALMVATEAKVALLHDLDIRADGRSCTGTSTDAAVIACLGRNPVEFAGPATGIGRDIGFAVRKALQSALDKAEGLRADRPMVSRLGDRGISLDVLVGTGMALYIPGPGDPKDPRERLEVVLRHYLQDINIRSLLEAAIMAEDAIGAGRLDLAEDPSPHMADELLGLDIAEYIGGKRALFNFARYDRAKPGILAKLGPFLDDAIGGLVAGCMTRALEAGP